MKILDMNPKTPLNPFVLEDGLPVVVMELLFVFGKFETHPNFYIGTGTRKEISDYKDKHGGEYVLGDESFLLSEKDIKMILLINKDIMLIESEEIRIRRLALRSGLNMVEKERGTLISFPNLDIELDYIDMILEEYHEAFLSMKLDMEASL